MREQYIKIHNLSVAKELADFVKNELLLDTNIGPDEFWKGFDRVVHELAPKNKKLLEIRETCLLYTSPSPRDLSTSRMPSSA